LNCGKVSVNVVPRSGSLCTSMVEIAGTDNADFREGLKWRAMFLEKLLGQLDR
jgi:hypothetical protein